MNRIKIDNRWFFSKPGLLRIALVFIKGDAIILLPLSVLIIITCFVRLKLGLIAFGLYVSIRFFTEMFYWMFQQFGKREYRPFDFGLNHLDNNAIYILYQLHALFWTIAGFTFLIAILLYL